MLTDEQGRRVTPGAQIGTRGGEGCVFEVAGDPSLVAKLYHQAPDPKRIVKLRSQCAASQDALREIAAWPQSLLLRDGRPAGFLMRRVQGRPAHELYRPVDRLRHFPEVTWQHLVAVSRNVATAFCVLHTRGVLMADVNESNLLITARGEARLIDCDSFQLTDDRGFLHPCEVGTAMWTPPELQGRTLAAVPRTEQHDLFGLAVLIFHLLFMGRHPFAGVPRIAGMPPDLTENIRRHQFAYSQRVSVDCLAPPHSITLASMPPPLADLFEQAFLSASRPTAVQWRDELDAMRFHKCRWGHFFSRSLSDCPWCGICDGGGPAFFIAVSHVSIGAGVPGEMTRLLAEIEGALPPAAMSVPVTAVSVPCVTMVVPTLESLPLAGLPLQPVGFPLRAGHFLGWGIILASVAACFWAPEAIIAWMLFAVAGWVMLPRARSEPLNHGLYLRDRSTVDSLHRHIVQVIETLRRNAATHVHGFAQMRDRFVLEQQVIPTQARAQFDAERARLRTELNALLQRHLELPQHALTLTRLRREELQLADHLRKFQVSEHSIPQIGPARSQLLARMGIETALDVRQMTYLDHLGRGYTELRQWLSRIEAQFRFNPSLPLSPAARADLQRARQDEEQALWRSFQVVQAQWHLCSQNHSDAGVQRSLADAVRDHAGQLDQLNHQAEQQVTRCQQQLDQLVRQFNEAAALLQARWGG